MRQETWKFHEIQVFQQLQQLKIHVWIRGDKLNKSTASGAKYARSSVISPHHVAFCQGEVDAVKRGPKLNQIKNLGKEEGVGGGGGGW